MSEQDTTQEDNEAAEMLADALDNGDDDGEDASWSDNGSWTKAQARDKIAKVNSEAANLRQRLKELEPLAKKAQELEEAGKSETQREREARESAEKRAGDAESRLMRLEVAHAKGLTAAQAKRLVGSTKEELEADADDLMESFGRPDERSRRPRERLRPGAASSDEPELSPQDQADLILKRSRGL